MNFPVSSEHSCTEVCARTTVRKAQGASNLPGEDKGFTTAFHKRPNNKLLLEIRNEQESEHWLHFSSCWNIPHSCKWLSDLWDTDQNRKLNPRSRSGTASDISPASSCPLFMFKDWTVKWRAKQHRGSMSRSQLVFLCSHTRKQKVEAFLQLCHFKFKSNQKWFHLKW